MKKLLLILLAALSITQTWGTIPSFREMIHARREAREQEAEFLRLVRQTREENERDNAEFFKDVTHIAIGTIGTSIALLATKASPKTCQTLSCVILPGIILAATEDSIPTLKERIEKYYIKTGICSLGLGALIAHEIIK